MIEREQLKNLLAFYRLKQKKIVFTNGCFDLLHLGHITYLEKAKALGNILMVGLNSDNSVKKLKGIARPILDQNARSQILAALQIVDNVIIFEEDTPYSLIQQIEPDILVKGGDYQLNTIVGADFVLAKGGKVEIIPIVEGYSTTVLIEKSNIKS